MAGTRLLLVEGPDDEHVVKNICGARGLGHIDRIVACGGKERLLDSIAVRIKESDVGTVGVLVDADADISATWAALKSRLEPFGYRLPEEPNREGVVAPAPPESDLPRLGVWIMPNNKLPGILEDFLGYLAPADDPLLTHVKESIQSIPAGACRFSAEKRPKAEIHTWLAWQDEPGKPLGQAISARYFDVELDDAKIFSRWLEALFFMHD